MNSSAIDNGLAGIRQGMQGMAKAASTVASNIHSPADLTEALVTLKSQATLVEASAKMIETSNEALGTILDILA